MAEVATYLSKCRSSLHFFNFPVPFFPPARYSNCSVCAESKGWSLMVRTNPAGGWGCGVSDNCFCSAFAGVPAPPSPGGHRFPSAETGFGAENQ